MPNAGNRSATITTTSRTPKWRRALAGIVSGALAIGGLSLSPLVAEVAQAAPSGTIYNSGGWHSLAPLGVGLSSDSSKASPVGLKPLDKWTLYGSTNAAYKNEIFYLASGPNAVPTVARTTIGYIHNAEDVLGAEGPSTIAVDADPYGTRGAKYLYAWPWNSGNAIDIHKASKNKTNLGYSEAQWKGLPENYAPIIRIKEGESTAEVLMVPRPNSFAGSQKSNGQQYWSGGEVIQRTGEIFFGGGECTGINNSYNMMILNPVTGQYWFSGKLVPNTPSDNIFTNDDFVCRVGPDYVASDFALDANGNAYISVLDKNRHMWLVRVVPSRTGGDWKYNLVTRLTAAPGQSSRTSAYVNGGSLSDFNYGAAFYNGKEYVTSWISNTNTALFEVNPMSGQVYSVPRNASNPAGVATRLLDLASGQTAVVLEGVLYNDLNGNGYVADDGYIPLVNQTVALYYKNPSGVWTYEGQRQTDGAGNYSFLVGGNGDYLIRVVRPSLDGINGVQTWGSSYIGNLPGSRNNEARVVCTNGDILNAWSPNGPGAVCDGAIAAPAPDPALPTAANAAGQDTSTQPGAIPIRATVHIESDQEVIKVDFGLTFAASGGDASTGPADVATAAIHNNNANPPVWLGANLGRYVPSTATDDTAHNGTDDGVYIDSYAGKISLTGTILAATKVYNIAADVSGPQANTSSLHGWLQQSFATSLGGPAWNPTPKWNPTIYGNKATGTLQLTTAPVGATPVQTDFRTQVSTVNITVPTNDWAKPYQAGTPGVTAWTTPGEVEDYQISGADTVYRPAAITKSGSGEFTVDAQTLIANNTKVTVGAAKAAASGPKSVTATVPDASWTVASVAIKDVETGNVVHTPAVSTYGNSTTITWTPALGDDVIVEVLFSKNPSAGKSVLLLSNATATVGSDITATAIIRDNDGNLLENVVVTFESASPNTVLSSPTCTTNAAGECSISITSNVAGTYADELSAKVVISGVATHITNSPQTVTFLPAAGSPAVSELTITPTGPLSVDDGVNIYTATTTVYDGVGPANGGRGNLVPNETVTYSITRGDGSPVDPTKTRLSDTTCSSSAVAGSSFGKCNVTLTSDETGTFNVHAYVAGANVVNSPTAVVYVAGAVCIPGVPSGKVCDPRPSHQTRIFVDPNNSPADGVSPDVVHVQAFDSKGNARINDEFILSTTDPALTIAQRTLLTGVDGTNATDTFSNVAGDHVLRATVNGIALSVAAGSPLTVSFKAGEVDPDQSTLVLDKNTTTAGAPIVATVTVKDARGNLVTDGRDVTLTVSGQATFGTNALASPAVTVVTCTTGPTGSCSVSLTDWKAETIAVTAVTEVFGRAAALSGSPAYATFTAGAERATCASVATQCSSLSASPTALTVGTNSVVTAFVTDVYGNPKQGAPVYFGVNGSATLRDLYVVTNSDGFATTTVTDDVAESVSVTGAFGAAVTAFVQSPVSVLFTVGAPDPDQSFLSLDKTNAQVGDPIVATVTAKDARGNLLRDVEVSFSVTGQATFGSASAIKVGTTTCITTAYGTCSVALTDLRAETVAVRATVDVAGRAIDVTSSPASATFEVGTVADQYSEITVIPSTQVVGVDVTVSVRLRDINENPVNGLGQDKFVITTTNDKGAPALVLRDFTQLPNGVYTFKTTSQTVANFTFAAIVDGVSLSERPVATFIHAGTAAATSYFEITVNDQLANGVAQDKAVAHANDVYGNPVPGASVVVYDQTTGANAGILNPRTATCTTGSDGTCELAWSATRVGTYTGQGTIDWLSPSNGSGILNQIRFSNGNASPANSELVVTPTYLTVGQTSVASVTVRDGAGILVPGAVVSFWLEDTLSDRADGTKAPWLSQTYCETGYYGTCSVTLTSQIAGETKVHATLPVGGIPTDLAGYGNPLKASPQSVTFQPEAVCYPSAVVTCSPTPELRTRVEVTKNGAEANGIAEDIATAYAFDRWGNAISGIDVQTSTTDPYLNRLTPLTATDIDGSAQLRYTSTVAGNHVAAVLIGGVTPQGSPVTLTFGSGAVAYATLTQYPAGPIEVDQTYTLTVKTTDVTGNPVSGAVVAFGVPRGLTITGAGVPLCTTSPAGECSITVTTIRAGAYDVSALLPGLPVTNSPATLVFTAGPVCTIPNGCVPDYGAPQTGVLLVVTGQLANGIDADVALLRAFDKHGNPVGGAVVDSTTLDATLNIVKPINPTGADGSTIIQYTSLVSGEHLADVTVDGKTPLGLPLRPAFAAGKGDASRSSWTITPAGPLVVGTGRDSAYTASVTVRDSANNVVRGAIVAIVPAQPDVTFPRGTTCTTNAFGVCQVPFFSTKSGTFEFSAHLGVDQIQTALSRAWEPDEVCAEASGCVVADPGTPAEKRTRVEVTTNGVTADGTQRDVVTAYAFDQWGNAVPGALVKSSTADTTLAIQTGIAGTNAAGESTIWYSSLVAGSHVALVTIDDKIPANGIDDTGSVTLNFVPGPASADHSTFAVDVNTAEINTTVTGTATVRDINNNVIPGAEVTFGIDGSATVTPVTGITGVDGTATVDITDSVAESVNASATILEGGVATEITGSPQNIVFTHGSVHVLVSNFHITPPGPLVANGVDAYTGTFEARDVAGNPVLNLDHDDIVFDATHDATDISEVSHDGNGNYTVQFTSTEAHEETDSHTASLTHQAEKIGLDLAIPFIAGDPVADKSFLAADPTTLQAGEYSTATATIRDDNDNSVPGVDVTFGVTGSAVLSDTTCTTDASGICSVTVTDRKTEFVDVSATILIGGVATEITNSPVELTFLNACVPGRDPGCDYELDVDDDHRTRVEVTVDYQREGGDRNVATAYYFDKFGNAVAGADVQSQPVVLIAPALHVLTPRAATNPLGLAHIDYTANTAGAHQADVSIEGIAVLFIPQPGGPNDNPDAIAAKSSPVTLNFVDLTAPLAPVIVTPLDGTLTNDRPVLVEGTAEGDSLVTVVDQRTGSATLFTATTDSAGDWSDSVDLADGTYDLVAYAVDKGGNRSPNSVVVTVTVDTVAPDAPIISRGNATEVAGEAGSAEPDALLTLTWPDGSEATTVVNPDGSWTIPTPAGTPSGEIIATATDAAGNTSPETIGNLDTEAPEPPFVDPTNGTFVTGQAEPSAIITITKEDGTEVECTEGLVVAASDTSFKCTVVTPLAVGDVLHVTATDPSGNESDPTGVIVTKLGIYVEHKTRLPGDEQVVRGEGFVPGETLVLEFFSDPKEVGRTTAGADGAVVIKFDVPLDTTAGVHTVRLTGDISGKPLGYVETTFLVTEPVDDEGAEVTPPLPPVSDPPYYKVNTGGSVLTSGGNPGSVVALLLLGLGVAVVGMTSRRNRGEA